MLGLNRRSAKLIAVISVSIVVGFLLGNLTDLSVRTLNPFLKSNKESTTQISFAEVSDRVNESVVSVISTKIVDFNQIHEGFEGFEFWPPVRPEEDGKRKSLGYGSGFVVDGRGLIVTNDHVIDDARHITVRMFDGKEYPADLLGTDKETDLALLKIDSGSRLMPAHLGDSDRLRVGDWVMAVGNPYNYEHTVTVGVVSAKNRKIDDNPFERYIQTDAAINFGNSGGPLFNTQGEVVAINAAISTKGRGIGFAIPINLAKEIIDQLEERGKVVRGFLGLGPDAITEEHVKILHLPSKQGILVAEVSPNTAAATSGIKRYDVITEINGKPVFGKDDFFRRIAQTAPGTLIKLKGIRDQREMQFDVIVRERHSSNEVVLGPKGPTPAQEKGPELTAGGIGIAVQELTEQQRKSYQLQNGVSGVVIANVSHISPAADAGLSAGEIILEINKHPVKSLTEYQKLISHFKRDGALMLLISRPKNYNPRIVTLKLDETQQR
jgi:serine protease Do